MKEIIKNADIKWKAIFLISFLLGIVLLIASFVVPPTGVIDTSVLAAVGELFAFPTLYAVYEIIQTGRSATFKKGDMEVTINTTESDDYIDN